MPEPDLLRLFVAPLERMGARYMVTGSVATIAYGEPRLTVDIDVVLDLDADQIPELRRAFAGPELYCPSEESILHELSQSSAGHVNVIHPSSGLKIDIYLKRNDPLHSWAFERRRRLSVGDLGVWFAPPEYVIVRKLQYFKEGGSPKHLRDVRSMLAVRSAEMDTESITSFADRLGVSDLWERVRLPPTSTRTT